MTPEQLEKEIREKDKEIKEKHIYQRIQYEEDKELLLKEIFSLKEKIEKINHEEGFSKMKLETLIEKSTPILIGISIGALLSISILYFTGQWMP